MFKKFINLLFSPALMGIILLVGAFSMGAATFIENDFGSAYAREVVYNAWWFEALIVLFGLNLIGSIFHRKLYKPKKFSIFLFHIAFIIMILGAAFTRYIGFEGMMHIREGESSDFIVTQQRSLNLVLTDADGTFQHSWSENKVNRKSGFSDNITLNGHKVKFELVNYLPDAREKAEPKEGGHPIIAFVLADSKFKGQAYIEQGNTEQFGNTTVAFDNGDKTADLYFSYVNDTFYLEPNVKLAQKAMGDDAEMVPVTGKFALQIKTLYQSEQLNLVVQEALPEGHLTAVPSNTSNRSGNKAAFIFDVTLDNQNQQMVVWMGSSRSNQKTVWDFGDVNLSAYYGYQKIYLPFSIYLEDFVIDRYPGSHSPSSYSSYVKVLQEGKEAEPFHIYMNNILKLKGYRFYQSSYDNDEKGTILSVNYDSLGSTVTYIGYFILFLGIVLSMLNKNTFLKNTVIPKILILGFIITALHSTVLANDSSESKAISVEHADKFGQLLVHDMRGRTEPVYTFASDLMRKISRKEKINGLTPVQVMLGMSMNYEKWMNVPMIKVSNAKLQKELGLSSNYACYNDFIVPGIGYKLQKYVETAFNKPPSKQDKFDKEVIKVDERVNICYAIYSGTILKMFPIPGSEDHKWAVATEAENLAKNSNDSTFLANILAVYFQELTNAKITGNYKKADEYVQGIHNYQQHYAGYELPSAFKVKTELLYYKWNPFNKLFPFYTTIGIIFLFVLLGGIISGKTINKWVIRIFTGAIFLGFLAHTIGFITRWYISGYAPMSNGFESLVFISWTIVLVGFIFSRQSWIALSATSVLAGFALMVANLSFMDPEITNLVPVLKSIWLTIHVSVITSSYGFLAFGAILGIINLILNIIQNKSNYQRIEDTIEDLTKINHRTMIMGLYFLTIGTFLGAVWANESWGRYWGWDPKETWSLISMIIYTFVTHARLIKGLRGRFAFNTMSVYAFFSILMTYFGVNYYLSGMHSYAQGDPVPIPTFVYVSVGILIILTIVAWFRFQMQDEKK